MLKILFSASTEMLTESFIENEINANCVVKSIISVKDLEDNRELLSQIEAWVVHPCPDFKIDSAVKKYLPNLRLICTPTTGTTHLNIPDLNSAGIEVIGLKGSNVVDSITASSEFTLIHTLNAVRNFTKSLDHVKKGKWRDGDDSLRGREISEISVGIIGLGRIGGNLAKWLGFMGSKVHFFDPHKEDPSYVKHDSIQSFLPLVDVVALCVHLDEDTFGLFSRNEMQLMKPSAWLVNTSRGEVLIEEDLIWALENKIISGASIDVIANENSPDLFEDNILLKASTRFENLFITPHVAGLTYDSEAKAQKFAYAQAVNFINN